MARRLEQLIGVGLLSLLAVMPFHAFLTVWLGSVVGHRALLQSWKELLLVVLAGLTVALIAHEPQRLQRLRPPVFWVLGAFALVAMIVTVVARPAWLVAVFGLKTDLEFLLVTAIAVVASNAALVRRAVQVSLVAAAGVVAFGLAQVWLLPPAFLTHFGYGPDTIAPYQMLDPAVSSLRFASTLGGPNQLGAYLTLVIALSVALAWRRRRWRWGLWALALGAGIVLIHTYSRAAWIGAAAAVIIVVLGSLRGRWRWGTLAAGGVLLIGGLLAWPQLTNHGPLQYYLLHGKSSFAQQRGSDFEHLASLQGGLQAVTDQPLGHGLGTAGPTVFHTGSGRIIENYYLQLGYEAGLLGMLLFMVGLALVCWRLAGAAAPQPLGLAIGAAILGISLNALVLPAWTDSTTALVAWSLAGLALGSQKSKARHV
jgi:hypothetical protein